MTPAEQLAHRQRDLTIAAALEKLMLLFTRLEANQDHEGRELARGVIWDLWDLKVGP